MEESLDFPFAGRDVWDSGRQILSQLSDVGGRLITRRRIDLPRGDSECKRGQIDRESPAAL